MFQSIVRCMVGILLAMVVGCTSTPATKASVVDKAKAESMGVVKCTAGSLGCYYTATIQNFEFDERHPLLVGLDAPAKDKTEREWRTLLLPGQANEEFRKGRINASKPRTVVIHLWGVDAEKFLASSSAFSVDSRGSRKVVEFENVTGKVPVPRSDPVYNRGNPTLSIRLRADAMAELSFPWDATYPGKLATLTCTEDRDTIYPNKVTDDRGLWVMEESYDYLRQKGSKGTYQVLFSKPATSVVGRGVK